ncbi:uncharacterized protein Bfra_008317 [Botrytis fragariae]|uniref:Uncharacterized protein n=1 Tax=Botrytis fragariae TaxID=1964551 RepID=A0A8H6ATA7_9HELO|nr:uncharacterized protein Bfra_008317 [Botrytis fragariae]KAF5873040.1 hypothetical protein Bfra_008317 [Botrytis fragariae]
MSLCAADIRVGCILRPLRIPRIHPGVPCEWNALANLQNVNHDLGRCPPDCRQDIIGQEHPIVVLKINGDSILYMTGRPIKLDQEGTQYSPIGHYFPQWNGWQNVPHPETYRSRYWLRGPYNWNYGTIDQDRQNPNRSRILELEEHSKLRLPHVYSQSIARFKPFGGDNTSAKIYRLDEGSYYRLIDRLGLSRSNYDPEIAPRSTSPSSRVSTSSTPDTLPNGPYSIGRSKNGPSQIERRQDTGKRDHKASNKNLPKWVALLRSFIRPYNEQDGDMKSCKIRKTSNPVAEDFSSPEPGLNESLLPYIITLQCTV